jgi:RNA polymerase sigma-70 factor, ECF subfamily
VPPSSSSDSIRPTSTPTAPKPCRCPPLSSLTPPAPCGGSTSTRITPPAPNPSRRAASTQVTGPELTDVAHQAAGDAILAKLAGFRGESRFTTWAYRFVILEVSSKLGRHYWRNPTVALDAAQWERLPDVLGIDPEQHAESAGILAEVRRVVDEELTERQRRIFVAVVVDGIPLDALTAKLGLQRKAVYKVVFDARRKIRRALVANRYLEDPGLEQR